jgi:phosphoribosylglycinamide formyltransferase-1
MIFTCRTGGAAQLVKFSLLSCRSIPQSDSVKTDESEFSPVLHIQGLELPYGMYGYHRLTVSCSLVTPLIFVLNEVALRARGDAQLYSFGIAILRPHNRIKSKSSKMTTSSCRVFLALRSTHQALLPMLGRLALPVVCLTREASELLQGSGLQHVVEKDPSGELEITSRDVLVASLVPDRVDVLLHSLIRSCCERKAFILVRSEDLETFSLSRSPEELDALRSHLLERAFQYCGGFDMTLARKMPGTTLTSVAPGGSTVTIEASEMCDWIQAIHRVIGQGSAEGSATVSLGSSKQSQVGPSADAMAIAKRIAPDADVVDEVFEYEFVFFADGEMVFPAEDGPLTLTRELVSSRGRDVDEAAVRTAFANARAAMSRATDACAFASSPLVGPLVLRVSKRGRVVGVVTDQRDLESTFKTISNLHSLLVCCAQRTLGYEALNFAISHALAVKRKVRIAALGSTPGGTSLQPILDELKRKGSHLGELCELAIVLSDKDQAGVLRRGREFGLEPSACVHLSAKGKSRAEFDARVSDELERRGVDLVVLVGYMRIVSNEFCAKWRGRILNVHPSLLPDFAGGMDLEVHAAVLKAGKSISGCTVHLVTEVVDGGPIVLQKQCPVDPAKDTKEDLKARVQRLEGPCLVESILAFATRSGYFSDRLTYESAGVSTARGDALVERVSSRL